VPSPSSCVRCSKPLAVLSPGGLCPACAATAATPEPTFLPNTPLGPDLSAPTGSADLAGATRSADSGLKDSPLPHAPAGYDLLERLGTGGMGSVYLAREHASERLVAMKFLHQPGSLNAIDRFLVELRVLVKLDHPNIVRVFANDFLRAGPFFTMEHMPGGTLAKLTSPADPMPAPKAVRLIRPVVDAIAAAHARGVIHRDLKPSNILLAADGTPKVADFGLAKRLDQDDGVTLGSGALGTPSYMPPEQISSKNGNLGPWSDVYGLGATLYQLVTGRAPFIGETSDDVISQVLADPPTRPRALRPDLPPALEGIVVKCLEKDPKDRYQSVAELAADLDRFTAGLKPAAPPLTRWRRARRWVRRNRRDVTAAALAVLVLCGMFALGAAIRPGGTTKADDPPDPLKEMQDDLAAGRPVALLTPDGRPRWHEWRYNPATLGGVDPPDGTCSFESLGLSMLDLYPAPAVPKYRISLELRHMGGRGPAPNAQRGIDLVGLYFAADTQNASGGRRVTSLFAVLFNDSPPRPIPNVKPVPVAVEFKTGVIIEKPNLTPGQFWEPGGNRVFKPAQEWPMPFPGDWRKVVVDVTPELLTVQWYDAAEKKLVPAMHWDATRVSNWTGAQATARYAQLQGLVEKGAPGSEVTVRPWSPQLPIGVYAYHSRVAIRSAVIEPLP
jgi:serine/threonine-protein kinase